MLRQINTSKRWLAQIFENQLTGQLVIRIGGTDPGMPIIKGWISFQFTVDVVYMMSDCLDIYEQTDAYGFIGAASGDQIQDLYLSWGQSRYGRHILIVFIH